ncbi:uncharacterized protein LOC118408135 [Branchiostoma floridae]|uniref:Uncharacterized protein LOC118408135 n=1 Tax=Branchiostoma floridae TaxID=7739 RepID=A0A9J7HRX6_BRAFL|nr:uncharacterized protein LOC118408135 [Branchiostoma floridae]
MEVPEQRIIPIIVRVMGNSGPVLSQYRSNITLSVLGNDMREIPKILDQYLGLKEVAGKVGLKCFDVTLARYDVRSQSTFTIHTQQQFDVEMGILKDAKSELAVTVKERKVLLTNDNSRIVVQVGNCSQHQGRQVLSSNKRGRKKKVSTLEDGCLLDAIKNGRPIVRNQRQAEEFKKLTDGLAEMNSTANNELLAKCGSCHQPIKLPTDRTWKGRVKFFKLHYEKCRERQRSSEKGKQLISDSRNAMASWLRNAPASSSSSSSAGPEMPSPEFPDLDNTNIPDLDTM